MTSAASDPAAARRQLEVLGVLQHLLDFQDFRQVKAWVARGGVDLTPLEALRAELIERRLTAIVGLSGPDYDAAIGVLLRRLSQDQRNEMRSALEIWRDKDGSNGTTRP